MAEAVLAIRGTEMLGETASPDEANELLGAPETTLEP